MKVALVHNRKPIRPEDVIRFFGIHTSEYYGIKTILKVASSLRANGHNVMLVNGNKNVINKLEEFFSDVDNMGIVFNMSYGIQGTSRYSHIPSILEMTGIPYVGSSTETHTICQNKITTKILLKNYGITSPKFWEFNSSDDDISKVRFPVIVKPVMESSSDGIHIAKDQEDLKKYIHIITQKFNQKVLVEQFIPGREFTVSMIGNTPNVEILPIVEFDFCDDPMLIQTKQTKSKCLISKICPAQISLKTEQKIRKICLKIFEKFNIRDYCRIDFRLDTLGNIYVLEVNSMTSLGVGGSLTKSAKTAGYSFTEMINRICDIAVLRTLNLPSAPGITQVGENNHGRISRQ